MALFITLACAVVLTGFLAPTVLPDYLTAIGVPLLLVIAMGTQNTLHHFIAGPMTTVMTGTVMNTTASLTENLLCGDEKKDTGNTSITLWGIGAFAAGCLCAGFLSYLFGIGAIGLTFLIMVFILAVQMRHPAGDKNP